MRELNKEIKSLTQDLTITKCQSKDLTLDRVMPELKVFTTRSTGGEKALHIK